MNKKKLLKIKEDIKSQFRQQDKLTYIEFVNTKNYDIIKDSGLFDHEYYFLENPDVKECGYDPIEHYITLGAYENCNPNNEFNTADYLFNNPDVAKSDFNPFVHYLIAGFEEDRKIKNGPSQQKDYFISIIMPTYNRKKIISRAIDSVLKQTFQNFELIIIDDGSEDNTQEFIKRKYNTFLQISKIRYFKLDHNGLTYARNFGLDKSKGNLIAYLDSDNEWNPNFLESMISELNKHETFNCGYCITNIDDKINKRKITLNNKFNRKRLLKENFIDLNSFIHEKKLYESRGGFDSNLTNLTDWDLIIRYTDNNLPFFVNKKLVNKFLEPNLNNLSSLQTPEDFEKIQQKYWFEIYSEEYESIVEIFDQNYYLEEYEDVLKSGMHPICHYLIKGHDEGKNPNPYFVTSYYKNRYPDVIRNELNTFYHFAKWGDSEGREINYYKKYNEILNNNLIHLSNYTFEKEPLVSIIIMNRNGLKHLKRLFENFTEKTNYSNFEIIVVDNDSTDDSVNFLKEIKTFPITIIENCTNVSFAKGNNDAVKIAKGEYVLLLNNDMEPTYGWLNEMMGTIVYNKNVGAVGAKLIYPFIEDEQTNKYSFTIQHAGDIFREETGICVYKAHNQNKFLEDIFDNSISFNRKCLLVTGAALLTKKDIYLEIGGLDENFWYGYEDVDYNLRLYKNGYDTIFASAALLFHYESATRKKMSVTQNHELLRDKWREYLFPKVLKDKLEKKCFFTDKKLNFLYLVEEEYIKNLKLNKCIQNTTRYFKENEYRANIQLGFGNFNINDDVDIIIIFNPNYPINNINARENVIKILILNENDFKKEEQHDDFNGWDIIISNDAALKTKLKNSTPPVYYLDDFSELGKNIILSLYKTYLKEE